MNKTFNAKALRSQAAKVMNSHIVGFDFVFAPLRLCAFALNS
jgi:hypothetical protein